MSPEMATLDEDRIEYLFDGVGDNVTETGACSHECAGRTAHTQAMQAINPVRVPG